jgi:hypothetical protein
MTNLDRFYQLHEDVKDNLEPPNQIIKCYCLKVLGISKKCILKSVPSKDCTKHFNQEWEGDYKQINE